VAAPVWVLSVDLQTKTATFQSGMAEAAKSARGAFTDIKSGSGEMGRDVGYSMGEARHGVMMLGEEFGVHLPRGLTTFIASLGPVGAAMEAAFPFLAIILGATLLLEHLAKLHEEGEKLTADQMKFGLAAQEAFNSLDNKLLQAGIRADDLRGNHLAALSKQLELIDHQSMAELAQTFSVLAKAADAAFADVKSHWYEFGHGAEGAKSSLERFQQEYQALLAKGDDKGAANALQAKLDREKQILEVQKTAAATKGNAGPGGDQGKLNEHDAALAKLKAMNADGDDKAVAAQEMLVQLLQDQVTAQGKIGELKKQDGDNAKVAAAKVSGGEQSAAAKAAIESQLRISELAIQSDRSTADAQLQIQHASAADREAVEISFADRELAIQLDANKKQMSALSTLANDYPNALKALQEKAQELTAQRAAKVTEITNRAAVESAAKELQDLQTSEREKIEATMQGSAARMAAIAAAIHQEEALGLQETSFYRDLLGQRAEAARQEAEEEAKIKADAGRLMAESDQKMAELSLVAQVAKQQMADESIRVSAAMRLQHAIEAINAEAAIQQKGIADQIAALDKGGKDYNNKLLELQDKQKQILLQSQNEANRARDNAQKAVDQKALAAAEHFNDELTSGLTQVLMGHKSFAAEMNSIGNELVSGLMQNAMKTIEANLIGKESQAAAAARSAYVQGEALPGGFILGPIMAAAAFAGVSGYQSGTDYVPGFGTGDKVPAMLEPGEGVVPGGVMDNLRKMANSGNMGGGNHTYHVNAPIHLHASALDADGMDKVMDKHAPIIQKHFENALRRMNR
jgi:hypothetical protein